MCKFGRRKKIVFQSKRILQPKPWGALELKWLFRIEVKG